MIAKIEISACIINVSLTSRKTAHISLSPLFYPLWFKVLEDVLNKNYKFEKKTEKFSRNGVFIVIWESSDNQFGRPKKKVSRKSWIRAWFC